MNKKVIIIIVSIVLVLGVITTLLFVLPKNKKSNLPTEIETGQKNLKDTIGVTTDKKVVVKYKDKANNESYYVYELTYAGYIKYQYTFYPSETIYNTAKEKIDRVRYSVIPYDNSYALRLTLKTYNVVEKNVKQSIIDSFKNQKGYEILY